VAPIIPAISYGCEIIDSRTRKEKSISSLTARAQAIWTRLQQSPAQTPSWVPIPQERVDEPDNLDPALKANKQYFEIRLNEIYLTYQRQWFSQYDPMVLAVSEFSYAGQQMVVPFVVGPTMMEKLGSEVPAGMVFADTCVAGPHPYRGGDVAVTVILYQTQRQDYVRKLLGLVENTATVLDLVVPLSAYIKIAGVVLDGVEALTGTDGTTNPLIGRRDAFKPVETGYFVLTNAPVSSLNNLWVRNKQLVQGPSLAEATPFRGAEYVLYSVATTQRDDVSMLPFHPTWQRVLEEAVKSSEEPIWKSTKANMAALLGMLYTSPDLTETHAAHLADEWTETIMTLHDQAVRLSNLSEVRQSAAASDLDRVRAKVVSVLNM
jgi:hypothetical protein